ncbi:MAG: hypothetical protein ACU85U_07745 [Gammaproteobacteria bacterium]
MDESDLIYSKHCQSVTVDNKTVRVDIYGLGREDWVVEVVNEADISIVWDEQFKSDDAAYDEFKRTLREEGIEAFDEEDK